MNVARKSSISRIRHGSNFDSTPHLTVACVLGQGDTKQILAGNVGPKFWWHRSFPPKLNSTLKGLDMVVYQALKRLTGSAEVRPVPDRKRYEDDSYEYDDDDHPDSFTYLVTGKDGQRKRVRAYFESRISWLNGGHISFEELMLLSLNQDQYGNEPGTGAYSAAVVISDLPPYDQRKADLVASKAFRHDLISIQKLIPLSIVYLCVVSKGYLNLESKQVTTPKFPIPGCPPRALNACKICPFQSKSSHTTTPSSHTPSYQ